MKTNARNQVIIVVMLLTASIASGCSQSEPATNTNPASAVSNVTPQQQEAAKAAAQHESEQRQQHRGSLPTPDRTTH